VKKTLAVLFLTFVVSVTWADGLGGPVSVVVASSVGASAGSRAGVSIGPCSPSDNYSDMGRRAGLALSRARRAQAIASQAKRLAVDNAVRNEQQARHGHISRDYGTTLWRHIWGEKTPPDETRRVYRESGGINSLLWGSNPPTEEEFKSFSSNGGLVGAILNNQSQLNRARISLWLVWLVALAALLLAILAWQSRSRAQPEPEEEEEEEEIEAETTTRNEEEVTIDVPDGLAEETKETEEPPTPPEGVEDVEPPENEESPSPPVPD